MISIRKSSRPKARYMDTPSSMAGRVWSKTPSTIQCRKRWQVRVSSTIRREELNKFPLITCSQEAKLAWLSRSLQSRSSVAAKTLEAFPKDTQKSMACPFGFGRLDMLLCQVSRSFVNTVHPIWFLCLASYTDHEDTPNSFYSWVANSMTDKPPIDEGHAKVIEVMEHQASSGHKYSRRTRCKAGVGVN